MRHSNTSWHHKASTPAAPHQHKATFQLWNVASRDSLPPDTCMETWRLFGEREACAPAVPRCFSAGKQKKIWTRDVIHHSNAIYTQPWSLSSPENLSSSTLQTIHSLVVQEPRSGKQKLTHWKEMESPESWVLSLALPSTAPVTLDIVFFSEPRPQEDEDRRSLRVCPALSVTTCLIASGIPGSQG